LQRTFDKSLVVECVGSGAGGGAKVADVELDPFFPGPEVAPQGTGEVDPCPLP
jgi:hypothetical protein